MGRRNRARHSPAGGDGGDTFYIGVSRIVVEMSGNEELKEKRSAVAKIKDRIRAKYNVSIAEVGPQDVMDSAVVGLSVVSNDRDYVQSVLGGIPDFIDEMGIGRVIAEDLVVEQY